MAESIIKKPLYPVFKRENHTASAISLAAGEFKEIGITVTLSGYTPVAFYRVSKSGTSSGNCAISNFRVQSDTEVKIGVINTGSSAASVTITVGILYEQTKYLG